MIADVLYIYLIRKANKWIVFAMWASYLLPLLYGIVHICFNCDRRCGTKFSVFGATDCQTRCQSLFVWLCKCNHWFEEAGEST